MDERVKLPPREKLNKAATWYLKEIDEPPQFDPHIPTAATTYTADGKMLCKVGPAFNEWSDELKVEVLSHEAGHVAGGHDIRQGDRDVMIVHPETGEPQASLWNVCCDAAIHYYGGMAEWAVKEIGGVTYESLDIPPVPPEMAYDMLVEKHPPSPSGGGCGRESAGGQNGKELSGRAKGRAIVASIKGAREIEGKLGGDVMGILRELPELLPSYPDWMQEVLSRLKKAVAYDETVRRWTRETRRDVEPIMLPGRSAKMGIAAGFIIDASGSMSEDDLIKLCGAVDATPELASSQVCVFSDTVTPWFSVRDIRAAIKACPSGGTQFLRGAQRRDTLPDVPMVWITDGYTGDGWPNPHTSDEIWVITTEVQPPHGTRIQA